MSGTTPANAVSPQATALALLGFLGAVALNLHHLAFWGAPVALAATAWRWLATTRLPKRGTRRVAVVLLTLAVLASFRTLNGLEAGATLLTAMGALKLLEAQRPRDWLVMAGVTLFLLLAACLDARALWRLPLYAAELWLICTALYALGAGARGGATAPAPRPTAALLRASGRSLLLGLPLALVLFLFFPRLPGSFWALPETEEAVTGLGDEMSPGSISQLSESDEPALRVRFNGAVPPPAQRYWRGPVLHNFDGYTWRRWPGQFAHQPALEFAGTPYSYEVTLEPNSHNVLIALEMPQAPPAALPFAFYTFDYQLVAPLPPNRALSYTLQSYPQYRSTQELPAASRRLDLQLPSGRNPRATAMGQELRAAAADDAAFVAATLEYFRRGGFEYTLTPPRLDRNSVDDFLFNSRRGFCGHYASAFVMLMRAGGVPSRVVTGYLGGDWNRFGSYLLLRQSHAHAWAEVWLDGRGWVRVDPTAVVAPERLTRDLFDLLASAGSFAPGRRLRAAPWIGAVVQAWEATNAWWQDEFLGFNFSKQFHLLEKMGFNGQDWHGLVALLGAGFTLWALWLAYSLRTPQPPAATDAPGRAWRQLERKLTRMGLPRAPHEGPLAYAERIGSLRPQLHPPLAHLARVYARLRYGASHEAAELQRFQRLVRAFRPQQRAARPRAPAPAAAPRR
jgi:transglutaminase-like putative cysteine protease